MEQTIYFGAPGTGKSHDVEEMLESLGSTMRKHRVTMHPEYTYSDFVGQLLPTRNDAGEIDFKFIEGPFTTALKEAFSDANLEVYLILEEMSRGNMAAVFGDIFQLLDRNDLYESEYPIRNKQIADQIPELPNDVVYLPANFSIIGTVNVNDQNVFPMDTAFKRRFDWKYVSSKPASMANGGVDQFLNNPAMLISSSSGDIMTNWQSFYTALNEFIVDDEKGMGRNEDKQLGQFFIKFNDDLIKRSHSSDPSVSGPALEMVNTLVRNKLLLYLWQDVEGNSVFGQSVSLFAKDITSFDELFFGYGNKQVFGNGFLDGFLRTNATRYSFKDRP